MVVGAVIPFGLNAAACARSVEVACPYELCCIIGELPWWLVSCCTDALMLCGSSSNCLCRLFMSSGCCAMGGGAIERRFIRRFVMVTIDRLVAASELDAVLPLEITLRD